MYTLSVFELSIPISVRTGWAITLVLNAILSFLSAYFLTRYPSQEYWGHYASLGIIFTSSVLTFCTLLLKVLPVPRESYQNQHTKRALKWATLLPAVESVVGIIIIAVRDKKSGEDIPARTVIVSQQMLMHSRVVAKYV
jgi:hypothetical protein